MKEILKQIGRLTVRLEQDKDAQSPQEYGDTGLFLVAKHRQFFVPPKKDARDFNVEDVICWYRKTHHVFGLEAYIHSGVALALSGEGNFCDRQWDVSQLGAVFAAKKEWRLRKSARKVVESYVATWNEYLSGDVWGYIVEDRDGEHLDSCWGFYGHEYAKQQAIEALEAQVAVCDKIPTLKAVGVK